MVLVTLPGQLWSGPEGPEEPTRGGGLLTGPPAGAGGAQRLELFAAWPQAQPHTPQPLQPMQTQPRRSYLEWKGRWEDFSAGFTL